jgi:hypothetical protein
MFDLKQKKGDLSDTLIFVIAAFIFGIGMFVLIYAIPQISGGLRLAGLNNSIETTNAINAIDGFNTTINYGTFFVFVGLLISIFITSFLVRSHPIFMIMYILFMPASIILAVYLGNAYNNLTTISAFSSIYSQANLINLFFEHLVKITLVANILSMIIVFSKFSSGGANQQF